MQQVLDFFAHLFDVSSWPPRWHCGTWTSFHGWLYILSDLAIWSAYFAIPTALFLLLRNKKDIPLPRIFWLFMAFIMLCGISHLIDAIIFYWPAYRLSALIRFITALVSWITVISVAKVLPEAIKMKTSAEYEREINERKRVEKELLKAKEVAENSQRVKDQFLANMSHEIRTPLNAILGFAGQLNETKLDETQKEFIQVIQKAGDNLLVVINDILDITKIESGNMVFESVPVLIDKELNDLKKIFESSAAQKGIAFECHCDPEIPKNLLGDHSRLWQILLNLSGNAVKFTKNGSVRVEARLKSKTASLAQVEFAVIDTGIGISQEKINSIFNPFTQAEASITREFGGTGLGLTIVKYLVELQEGSLRVNSELGKGTIFSFTLPFKLGDPYEVLKEEKELELKQYEQKLKGLKVLLVEDNAVNRRLMEVLFKPWHIQSEVATNGQEALNILAQNQFDLILMDIQMPVMDGYTATQKIRQELKLGTPILALTAHALAEERQKCLEMGMNDFIAKPIKKEELFNKLVSYSSRK